MEWMDNLPEELKESEGLKKFGSVEDLAKSYVNLEGLRGNSIRIAGPDASAEDKAAVYKKVMTHMPELTLKPDPESPEQSKEFYTMLGVPEKPEDYVWEGDGLDAEVLTQLKIVGHNAHMTKEQFKAYANQMAEMQTVTNQTKEDARLRNGAELKGEWGMAFEDRYAVVEKYLSERPGLGGIETMSPAQIKIYYNDAIALTGKPQINSQPASQSGALTPQEAKARIQEIDGNPLFGSSDPTQRHEHNRLLIKRIELMKQAYPERYS